MNGYPTDEELSKLIEEVEKQPLYAPAHLQEMVLCKLNKEEQYQKEQSAQLAFFLYSFKIAVGMAAAIVLLFAIPANNGSNRSYAAALRQERETVSEKLDAHFESGKEKLMGISENVNEWIDKLFQREDVGGYDYES